MNEYSGVLPVTTEIARCTLPGRTHMHDILFTRGNNTNVESLEPHELIRLYVKLGKYIQDMRNAFLAKD
jgi:hypothetical protein